MNHCMVLFPELRLVSFNKALYDFNITSEAGNGLHFRKPMICKDEHWNVFEILTACNLHTSCSIIPATNHLLS